MKAKKSKKVDLRNKRGLFFEIGMIVALASVLVAFQYQTEEKTGMILTSELTEMIPAELMPITRMEQPKPPEPPKPEPIKKIEIVDNSAQDDPTPIFSAEDDPTQGVVIIAIEPEAPVKEPETFVIVENMPEYPGGSNALLRDIMSRVNYPEIAKENGIQGKVYVEFVVNSKGKVDKVQIIRGIDPSLNREALRVIKTLTGWKPGMQRGKAVNVKFTVPINFKLN